MSKHTPKQWPDNIASGRLYYGSASNYHGFFIAPEDHGIPTCGAVSVNVFNYPGQTEEIARRLVACWNALVGVPLDEVEARAALATGGRNEQ